MKIQLYNTLSRSVEQFSPLEEGSVRMYSCGPTIYNYAHIGNMRSFLFADFLHRVLKVVGNYNVRWVMNLTDIDDKTIRDSRIGSEQWLAAMGKQTSDPKENLRLLTNFYEKAFFDDITTLGIQKSDIEEFPRATDYIEEMQDLIRRIAEGGYAYSRAGSIYFDVSKWRKAAAYGRLHHIDEEHFLEGVRIDADEYEREQVSDFVLWKAAKEGEPSWNFAFQGDNLPGRPGWHIECSAMEYEILGLPFDIHTGGIDLRFPHHEDEIAQSTAGYGIDPTTFWCHNEFLDVEGEKMSKSKGNFYTLRDLLDRKISPVDIRYLMLSVHYRSKLNFTFSGLEAAAKARARVQELIYTLFDEGYTLDKLPMTIEPVIEELQRQIFAALADDLNSPKALAALFTFINRTKIESLSPAEKHSLLALLHHCNAVYGVWEMTATPATTVEIPAEILQKAEERLAAKKAKDWAKADALRGEITAAGYTLKDTKEGYELIPSV